jgi:hypothetical protein
MRGGYLKRTNLALIKAHGRDPIFSRRTRGKIRRQRKRPPEGGPKFREETPKKGSERSSRTAYLCCIGYRTNPCGASLPCTRRMSGTALAPAGAAAKPPSLDEPAAVQSTTGAQKQAAAKMVPLTAYSPMTHRRRFNGRPPANPRVLLSWFP